MVSIANVITMVSPKLFIRDLSEIGFRDLRELPFENRQEFAQMGWGMILDNPVHGGTLKDCSLLHILPAIILRPIAVSQLHHIVSLAFRSHLPLTFAAGKTGLSAGFANPYCVVDLEGLHTLTDPIAVDCEHHMVTVDQNVLVSTLIRVIPMELHDRWIFPTQPSSAFKLPVRIGGLISTNASGVTSGKLGPIFDWVRSIQIMTPRGDLQTITRENPLFCKIIGGNGQFGVILNAKIQLAPNPENSAAQVVFGFELEEIFRGLQHVQDAGVFPLLSELIFSTTALLGKFAEFFTDHPATGKWAILLKGDLETVTNFTHLISKHATFSVKDLDAAEFQLLLEERTSLALQTVSSDPSKAFVRYPGFDDLLMAPDQILPVFKVVNHILASYGYPNMIVGYGHINFRKGLGLLLHLRLPVSVEKLASDPHAVYPQIASVIAHVNVTLRQEFDILPKSEHGLGFLAPWVQHNRLSIWHQENLEGRRFVSPHLLIFEEICHLLDITPDNEWTSEEHKKVLSSLLYSYLCGNVAVHPSLVSHSSE